jgi:hypothetical protein
MCNAVKILSLMLSGPSVDDQVRDNQHAHHGAGNDGHQHRPRRRVSGRHPNERHVRDRYQSDYVVLATRRRRGPHGAIVIHRRIYVVLFAYHLRSFRCTVPDDTHVVRADIRKVQSEAGNHDGMTNLSDACLLVGAQPLERSRLAGLAPVTSEE